MSGRKRIAVCISGQTRTGPEAANAFLSFFEKSDFDVFFHTWYESKDISEKIIKLYKPRLFSIENPLPNTNYGSFDRMFFSMMCANDLKKDYEIKNGFRYDLVVRYRFDIIFHQLAKFDVSEKEKSRYIFSHYINKGFVNVDYEHHGINDLFFYGDSESMDIVSDSYKIYSKYLKNTRKYVINKMPIDSGDSLLSPGQLIYKLASYRNIRCDTITGELSNFFPIIWRTQVKDLDPINDFAKIKESQ